MNRLHAFFSAALLCIAAAQTHAQAILHATAKDVKSDEPVPSAVLKHNQGEQAHIFDLNGKVRINLEPGEVTVEVTMPGYQTINRTLVLTEGVNNVSFSLVPSESLLQAIDVTGIRAGEKTPMAHQTLSREELEEFNNGRDMPYILEQTPGLVTTSDAGAGIGYTGMRIRGSDQTRINVTINGIPVNDAESQGVFWVNMPDLASSLNSVQIQRGAGTSTNGPGAFGASVNLETESFSKNPYASLNLMAGSFNTQRTNFRFGSGLINGKWSFDGRMSRITSDGYIDRASSDLSSYYFSGGYAGKNTSVKFITFSGNERTYQSWNGIHKDSLRTNPTFNSAGAIYDENGNVVDYYQNEVDNYRQTHYQLHLNHNLSSNFRAHAALFYTKGAGYYEQFRQDARLSSVALPPVITNGDTVTRTDLVRRLWLDNDLYGGVYNLTYSQKNFELIIGGGASQYIGDHFGEVIWARYASTSMPEERFYFNDAVKTDLNQYVKAYFTPVQDLTLFADMQVRYVRYTGQGVDRNLNQIELDDELPFFNPKAGAQYQLNENLNIYASMAVAHREPARRDYIENPNLTPRPERLVDYEAGARFRNDILHLEANAYFMDYYDQLVLTGQLSDVGFALRENVGRSYRTGLEFLGTVRPFWLVEIQGNLAVSDNRNIGWQREIEANGQTQVEDLGNTPIAFSPNIVAGGVFSILPVQGLKVSYITRFVGRQYLDNTGNEELSLDPYLVTDFRILYQTKIKDWGSIGLNFFINNLLNERYANNGYVWGDAYIYPQATRNYLVGVTLGF